jgi:hypothetical protein
MIRKMIMLFISCACFCCACYAQARKDLSLTVYNDNLALIREVRNIAIKKGKDTVIIDEIPSGIEPGSIHFKSLLYPDKVMVLEQNYEFDLVSSDKLFTKYLGKKVQLKTKENNGLYQGYLMSFDRDTVVISEKPEGGETTLLQRDAVQETKFSELPEGLKTRPTLVWLVQSEVQEKQDAEISYLTSGISWKAEYVSVVSDDDRKLDLTGWVSIDNNSGTGYPDAKLKLMAGDVHRVAPKAAPARAMYAMAELDNAGGFEEKAFFEYHLYTLGRQANILDKQVKQIELLSASDIPAKKIYIFEASRPYWGGQADAKKVNVMMELDNTKKNNLGMALPKGTVRVYKKDTDGSLQFIGEDAIDHTPRDEKVRIYLGNAFDIIGERKKVSSEKSGSYLTENYEVSLRNHKTEAVTVICREHFYGDWTIKDSNYTLARKDAYTAEFDIAVKPDEESLLKYTVKTRIY